MREIQRHSDEREMLLGKNGWPHRRHLSLAHKSCISLLPLRQEQYIVTTTTVCRATTLLPNQTIRVPHACRNVLPDRPVRLGFVCSGGRDRDLSLQWQVVR